MMRQLPPVSPETTTKRRWRPYLPSTSLACTQVRSIRLLTPSSPLTGGTVPGSTELLVISPFTPKYTIHNSFLNVSTTVTTKGFDARSVQQTIPKNVAAYVANVTINGELQASRCHFDFYDVFKTGGDIVIEVTANKDEVDNCGASLPMSLSTGGFSVAR